MEPLRNQVQVGPVHLCAGIRHSRQHWRGFWAAFAHIVRNAIDHGIEAPERRRTAGKSITGKLELRADIEGIGEHREIVISIRDDGAGIDWAALEATSGVAEDTDETPAERASRRVALLFSDGTSSRASASEISGRGVGMSSILAAAQALDGRCEIESEPGKGTCLEFRFPYSRLFENRGRGRAA